MKTKISAFTALILLSVFIGITSIAYNSYVTKPIQEVSNVLLAQMTVPDSMKLSNVSVGLFSVCGEVQGKNAFGQYLQPKLFVATHAKTSWEVSFFEKQLLEEVTTYSVICKGNNLGANIVADYLIFAKDLVGLLVNNPKLLLKYISGNLYNNN